MTYRDGGCNMRGVGMAGLEAGPLAVPWPLPLPALEACPLPLLCTLGCCPGGAERAGELASE